MIQHSNACPPATRRGLIGRSARPSGNALRRWLVLGLGFLAVGLSFGKDCAGQNIFQWTITPVPFYDVSSNWSPAGPPTSIDVAQFNLNTTYEVLWDNLTASRTPDVGFVDVLAGDVTFQNLNTFQHNFTINQDLTVFGNSTQLTNSGLNLNVNGSTFVIGDAVLLIDGSHPAGSRFSATGSVLAAQGTLAFDNGAVGNLAGGMQLNVDAAGTAGFNVLGGSQVTAGTINIGNGSSQTGSSVGILNVSGAGSILTMTAGSTLRAGLFSGTGVQEVNINNQGVLDASALSDAFSFDIRGAGASLNIDHGTLLHGDVLSVIGGTANLTGGGSVVSREMQVAFGGQINVSGADSVWQASGDLEVSQDGRLEISGGGQVHVDRGFVADFGGGSVQISGADTSLFVSREMRVVGSDQGQVDVVDGGFLRSESGSISFSGAGNGTVNVIGQDSRWELTSTLDVGRFGTGILTIEAAGVVSNLDGFLSRSSSGVASATVTGTNSAWHNFGSLVIAPLGTGTLNIDNGGLVTVGVTTSIGTNGSVNLTGGRFEFGQTSLSEFGRINAISGSMAGAVNISGVNDLASLGSLQNPAVDLTEVAARNSGLLHGSAILKSSLNNLSTGELRTLSGQWARFEGGNNLNAGEINNFGGIVDFAQDMTNTSTGFVGGRGQFVADAGWTNQGVMAFSGTTDVLGDVANEAGGRIVTSGGATTTFFDDVLHNGLEIRTSAGSNTVIFGEASGAGAYTGTGTVFFEGDLRPGNSPDSVLFEGDVVLGTGAHWFLELAGTEVGLYDQMIVQGDLALDGLLTVDLIDGFQLLANQEFIIAAVGGDLSGQFLGLNDGDLVGNFGGRDLFISYSAGIGTSVSLFTAVPEPGASGLLAVVGIGCLLRRRRRGR